MKSRIIYITCVVARFEFIITQSNLSPDPFQVVQSLILIFSSANRLKGINFDSKFNECHQFQSARTITRDKLVLNRNEDPQKPISLYGIFSLYEVWQFAK